MPNSDALIEELKGKSLERLMAEYIRGGTLAPEHPVIEALIKLKLHEEMRDLLKQMSGINAETFNQVSVLTGSSLRLEKLTERLKTLTIWLIVLTVLSLIVPVSIEGWKAIREEPVVFHQPSAPAAPILQKR